jgi:hypothetical protein
MKYIFLFIFLAPLSSLFAGGGGVGVSPESLPHILPKVAAVAEGKVVKVRQLYYMDSNGKIVGKTIKEAKQTMSEDTVVYVRLSADVHLSCKLYNGTLNPLPKTISVTWTDAISLEKPNEMQSMCAHVSKMAQSGKTRLWIFQYSQDDWKWSSQCDMSTDFTEKFKPYIAKYIADNPPGKSDDIFGN